MNGRALIAANLRRLRLLKGYSLERLAHEAGVDMPYVWKLEQAAANPTIDILDKLASTLTVPVGDLLHPVDPDATEPPPLPRGKAAHRQ
ncbi:MAG TPA: helix-turn-helix transcriptional regulator [Caulobacteraceae bacterium]|nr:helix-turn-helix transcriptional regulator [Caulobacteraceae bacterium]